MWKQCIFVLHVRCMIILCICIDVFLFIFFFYHTMSKTDLERKKNCTIVSLFPICSQQMKSSPFPRETMLHLEVGGVQPAPMKFDRPFSGIEEQLQMLCWPNPSQSEGDSLVDHQLPPRNYFKWKKSLQWINLYENKTQNWHLTWQQSQQSERWQIWAQLLNHFKFKCYEVQRPLLFFL